MDIMSLLGNHNQNLPNLLSRRYVMHCHADHRRQYCLLSTTFAVITIDLEKVYANSAQRLSPASIDVVEVLVQGHIVSKGGDMAISICARALKGQV